MFPARLPFPLAPCSSGLGRLAPTRSGRNFRVASLHHCSVPTAAPRGARPRPSGARCFGCHLVVLGAGCTMHATCHMCGLGVLRRCSDAVPPSQDSRGLTGGLPLGSTRARLLLFLLARNGMWGGGAHSKRRPPPPPSPSLSLLGARAMCESMIAMEHGTYSTSSCGTAVRVPARMWLLFLPLLAAAGHVRCCHRTGCVPPPFALSCLLLFSG